MISRRNTFMLAALFGALCLVSVPASAQTPQPQAMPQIPDSIRQMLMELRDIREQLEAIQEQTLASNAALRAQQEAAEDAVMEAMLAVDPGVDEAMQRLDAMAEEARAAQAQQDTAAMRRLLIEGQRMHQQIQSAQAQAIQREDVAKRIEEYRDDLLAAMKKHDPRTEELIHRMEDLTERLQAAAR